MNENTNAELKTPTVQLPTPEPAVSQPAPAPDPPKHWLYTFFYKFTGIVMGLLVVSLMLLGVGSMMLLVAWLLWRLKEILFG